MSLYHAIMQPKIHSLQNENYSSWEDITGMNNYPPQSTAPLQ